EHDALQHSEPGEERGDLERAAEAEPGPVVRGEPGDVPLEETNPPGPRDQQAGDEVEESGLAGSVRPQDDSPLADTDRERDLAQRAQAAELVGEPVDRQRRHHRRPERERSTPRMPAGAKRDTPT